MRWLRCGKCLVWTDEFPELMVDKDNMFQLMMLPIGKVCVLIRFCVVDPY